MPSHHSLKKRKKRNGQARIEQTASVASCPLHSNIFFRILSNKASMTACWPGSILYHCDTRIYTQVTRRYAMAQDGTGACGRGLHLSDVLGLITRCSWNCNKMMTQVGTWQTTPQSSAFLLLPSRDRSSPWLTRTKECWQPPVE